MPRGVFLRIGGNYQARFWSKVCKQADGCWYWLGQIMPNGYGQFYWKGKKCYAHRASYEMFVGLIPEGKVIDHNCRNRSCVNPAHLTAITQRENLLKGETIPAAFASRDSCCRGHVYTEANTYAAKSGARVCRECQKIYQRGLRRQRRDGS